MQVQDDKCDAMPIIGAHVSAAGGLYNCFANAQRIGAECLQIFGASPRQWNVNLPDETIVQKFKLEQKRTKLGPIFFHAAYLANIGTHIPPLWKQSVENLALHLQIAEMVGAAGLVFHIGACPGDRKKALARIAKGMKEILERVRGKSFLIMENSAGGGGKIGSSPEEIGEIYHLANHPRVKICIDTQHVFAAGEIERYTEENIAGFVARCEKSFGWKNVVLLHANDSQSGYGSFFDRHENIGEGNIGLSGFKALAKNKHTGSLPWILEVPGFGDEGPDKRNVDILKKIAK